MTRLEAAVVGVGAVACSAATLVWWDDLIDALVYWVFTSA